MKMLNEMKKAYFPTRNTQKIIKLFSNGFLWFLWYFELYQNIVIVSKPKII